MPPPVPAQYLPPLRPELPSESAPEPPERESGSVPAVPVEPLFPPFIEPAAKLVFPTLAPLDKSATVPPLPASLAAVVTQHNLFDERLGKRKRKKNHGGGGRKKCPYCNQRKAVHVQPKNILARMFSVLGIRTFSCRACHVQHMGFGSWEGLNFTWRQLGVTFAILGVMALILVLLYPMLTHVPERE